MDENQLKEILKNLDLELPGEIKILRSDIPDFSIVLTGKKHVKFAGGYLPAASEIIICNGGMSEGQIISTAIHEFAHHIHFKCFPNYPVNERETHNLLFHAIFNSLLDNAEEKDLYKPQYKPKNSGEFSSAFISMSAEIEFTLKKLSAVTELFSAKIEDAQNLCAAAGVDMSEYLEREMAIPFSEARMLLKFESLRNNYEHLSHYEHVALAKMPAGEKRFNAADLYSRGLSHKQIKFSINEDLQQECKLSRVDYLKKKYAEKDEIKNSIEIQLSLFGSAIERESDKNENSMAS